MQKQIRLFLALTVLFIILPVTLYAFKSQQKIEGILLEGERAEAKGQYRHAARFYHLAWQAITTEQQFLHNWLEILQIAVPSKPMILYKETEMHVLAATSQLKNLKENPDSIQEAAEKLKILQTQSGKTELSQELEKQLAITLELQHCQTLYLAGNYQAILPLLQKIVIPDKEEMQIHAFIKNRLQALTAYRIFTTTGDQQLLKEALENFEACFAIDPDDPFIAKYHGDAEEAAEQNLLLDVPFENQLESSEILLKKNENSADTIKD
jgi:hypothetical protein